MLDAINVNISALHTQSMEHRQRGFQIMPTVNLDKLEDAMEWASSDLTDNEAYICRQTGKIYWIAGDPGMIDEEEIPEDIHDGDKYLPVPDKRNLDLGNQLAFDFTAQYLAQHYDDVRDMFRRQGAYRRFKDFLERKDMLEKWYTYSDEQAANALGEWCEKEGLSLGP
jgi:Uncharacterised protein family (UPF0158)